VPTFVFAYWGELGGGEGADVPAAAGEFSKFWSFQNASAET